MSELTDILSEGQNRTSIKNLTQRILEKTCPEEVEVAMDFVEPMIDMVAEKEKVVIDDAERTAGFGGSAMYVQLIAPAIAGALGTLIFQLGVWTIDKLKNKLKKEPDKKIQDAVNNYYMFVEIKSFPGGQKEVQKTLDEIIKALENYLL